MFLFSDDTKPELYDSVFRNKSLLRFLLLYMCDTFDFKERLLRHHLWQDYKSDVDWQVLVLSNTIQEWLQQFPSLWKDCAFENCDDEKTVLRFVNACGSIIHSLNPKWKSNRKVLVAAEQLDAIDWAHGVSLKMMKSF